MLREADRGGLVFCNYGINHPNVYRFGPEDLLDLPRAWSSLIRRTLVLGADGAQTSSVLVAENVADQEGRLECALVCAARIKSE